MSTYLIQIRIYISNLKMNRNRPSIYTFYGFISICLLFLFNNCSSKFNAESIQLSSLDSSASDISTPNLQQPETPVVTPPKVYIKQCVSSKQIAAKVRSQKIQKKSNIANEVVELNEFNKDIVLILNVECLKNKTDSLINYLPESVFEVKTKIFSYKFKKSSTLNWLALKQALVESRCLISASLDEELKLSLADPLTTQQRHLASIGFSTELKQSVLNLNSGLSNPVKIAIIDDGIDVNHPDIKNNIAKKSNGSVNGFIASPGGSDYVGGVFHGTHVTGLAAAEFDNGIGVSGVFGKNIKIYPVSVGTRNPKTGFNQVLKLSDITNGIIWAAEQKVDLINFSIGTSSNDPSLKSAIEFATDQGIVFVTAAANDHSQINTTETLRKNSDGSVFRNDKGETQPILKYPTLWSQEIEGLISVGSLDTVTNLKSNFSNFSPIYVDLLAPGSNSNLSNQGLISTFPSTGPTTLTTNINSTGYGALAGTSMAAPIFAGALSYVYTLAKSKNIQLTPSMVERLLKEGGLLKSSNFANFSVAGQYLHLPTLVQTMNDQLQSANGKTIKLSKNLRSQENVIGGTEEFSIDITSDSIYVVGYKWFRNNIQIPNETTNKLVIKQLQESDAATYHVEISNGTQKVTSLKADLILGRTLCE